MQRPATERMGREYSVFPDVISALQLEDHSWWMLSAGEEFDLFRVLVIDRSKTWVFAFLNIKQLRDDQHIIERHSPGISGPLHNCGEGQEAQGYYRRHQECPLLAPGLGVGRQGSGSGRSLAAP